MNENKDRDKLRELEGVPSVETNLAGRGRLTGVTGVIGGIGSGKSAVLEILQEKYGCAVFRTDDIAKELMQPGEPCFEALKAAFGTRILTSDGRLDKKQYGTLIYHDAGLLRLSDSIVHPAVWEAVERRVSDCRRRGTAAVIETALPGRQFYDICDRVWYVHTEKEVRIARLMRSRGLSRANCEEIIANQRNEDVYREKSDAVIENSGSISETEHRIAELAALRCHTETT